MPNSAGDGPGGMRRSGVAPWSQWLRRGALSVVAVQRKNELTTTISRKHLSESDGRVSSLFRAEEPGPDLSPQPPSP